MNYKLENEKIRIELQKKDLGVTLTDKSTSAVWTSEGLVRMIYGNYYSYNLTQHCEIDVKQEGNKLIINLSNMEFWARFKEHGYVKPDPGPDLTFGFVIVLKDNYVIFRIEKIKGMDDEECSLSFPHRLIEFNSNDNAQFVVPCGYGNLIQFPRTDCWSFEYEIGNHYTCLPIQGVFMEKGGLALYLKTPFDAQCFLTVNNIKKETSFFETNFVFEKNNANYARELHVYPMARNSNYVDLAKLYRKIVKDEGRFVSLNEKISQYPEVEKLVGSVIWKHNVYSKETPGDIKKGYSLYMRHKNHNIYEGLPNNWTAKEVFNTAKEKGFDRVCIYNTGWNKMGFDSGYPTRLPPNPQRGTPDDFKNAAAYARKLSDGYIYSIHDNYMDCYKNSEEFNENLIVREKNGSLKQGGIWRGGRAYIMCTSQSIKFAKRDIPQIAEMLGKGSIYIDVMGCTKLHSCHNPEHPQGKREDAESRRKLLKYIKNVMGSIATEGTPSDYLADVVDLGAFCGIYLTMINTLVTDPFPIPVPLWQLVYHDSVLNYTSEGAYGAYGSEYILYVALFGMLPTQFDDTSKKLSFELREAYKAEMISHEFLEPVSVVHCDDGTFCTSGVVKTEFANGTIVIANFKEKPYTYEDREIKGRDFLILNREFV